MTPITVYAKAHVAAFYGLFISGLTILISAGHFGWDNLVAVGLALLGSVLVFLKANTAGKVGQYSKAIVLVLLAVLQVVVPVLLNVFVFHTQALTYLIVLTTMLQLASAFHVGALTPNAPAALIVGTRAAAGQAQTKANATGGEHEAPYQPARA